MAKCAWCEAPKDPSSDTCSKCGANYAKAEAIRTQGRASPSQSTATTQGASLSDSILATPLPAMDGSVNSYNRNDRTDANESSDDAAFEYEAEDDWSVVEDAEFEKRLCLVAIPAMLLVALLFNATGLGASLQRIVFGMPIHELGHAVAGWFCGYSSIPTLWKTITPESRGFLLPVVLFAGLSYVAYWSYSQRKFRWLSVAVTLLALQAFFTFGVNAHTAHMIIVFAGDGLGMILGVVLMSTFYLGKRTQLYRGWLRWGFLAIGAAAFVDMYATWWAASSDVGAIPYGKTGGIMSDSWKLIHNHRWRFEQLTGRFFLLGNLCMLAIGAIYLWGYLYARGKAAEREPSINT